MRLAKVITLVLPLALVAVVAVWAATPPPARAVEPLSHRRGFERGFSVFDVDLELHRAAAVLGDEGIAIFAQLGGESLERELVRVFSALALERDEVVEHLAVVDAFLVALGEARRSVRDDCRFFGSWSCPGR